MRIDTYDLNQDQEWNKPQRRKQIFTMKNIALHVKNFGDNQSLYEDHR